MLKAAGLIGLVLCAGLAGMMKAEELKLRIVLLQDIQDMILHLRTQMNYMKEPLQILFRKMPKKTDSRAFLLPDMCLDTIAQKDADIAEIWAENSCRLYRKTPLTEDDLHFLIQIGTYLGQTDFENQQVQFQCTENRLHRQIEDAETIYRQKGSLYRRIGFFAGAAAAVVLL